MCKCARKCSNEGRGGPERCPAMALAGSRVPQQAEPGWRAGRRCHWLSAAPPSPNSRVQSHHGEDGLQLHLEQDEPRLH